MKVSIVKFYGNPSSVNCVDAFGRADIWLCEPTKHVWILCSIFEGQGSHHFL